MPVTVFKLMVFTPVYILQLIVFMLVYSLRIDGVLTTVHANYERTDGVYASVQFTN